MYRKQKTGVIGIIITIIIIILLVLLSNVNIEKFSGVESMMGKLVMPIQNGLIYAKNKIKGNDDFFTDINNLKNENAELKQKNSENEQKLRELEIIKAENSILKEYVNIKDKYAEYNTKPAYVIDKSISNFSSNLIINIGSNEGVKVNMTVIADKGLVGHVISVTNTTAKVQVIVDPANSVSSTLSTTRESIICRGMLEKNNKLKAVYIPTVANLVQEDNVETSGMGGIYPKGIHIGKIKEIVQTKNITDRYAIIETAVDFSTLETVLVIVD